MKRHITRFLRHIIKLLYFVPISFLVWYYLISSNPFHDKDNYDIAGMDQNEFFRDEKLRAGPILPPPNRSVYEIKNLDGQKQQPSLDTVGPMNPPAIENDLVVKSNENLGDDSKYDGENVNEIELYESDEEQSQNFDAVHQIQPPMDGTEIDRTAPGELGKPFMIDKDKLFPEEKELYDKGWKNNGFNEYASIQISLHRSLPDPRDKECKDIKYRDELPDASVILTFHNEAWTVLLRSVHSIIDRSPPSLLKEIILVDDFSDMEHLKKPLEDYMEKLRIVKIVRAKQREGLIRARILGYSVATAAALVYLDSHIECAEGWLEPLLHEIAVNKTTAVTPVIDVISDETFAYSFQRAKGTNVGGFDWSMTFTWHAIPEAERKRRNYADYLPVRSPTMAGGLFAISREFFTTIGTYDEGMDIWGAENLELSFRIWMCGGTLLTAPCSHVGHIFRKRSPYKWGNKPVILNNNIRMCEVWLDDFKDYYYQLVGYKHKGYGDVSSRKALRERLHCKDFNWYLTQVYPEMFVPGEALYSGQIKSKVTANCLYGAFEYGKINNDRVQVQRCSSAVQRLYWLFTKTGEIRHRYGCFDYNNKFTGLTVSSCHGLQGNQEWEYREDNTLKHKIAGKCVELSADGKNVTVQTCTGIDRQIWYWDRHPPKGPVRRWNQ